MAATLASLVSRLQGDVPARDGVPSSDQYNQAVKDAVLDLNERVPVRKVTTLAMVAGQADYTLPADFVRLDRLYAVALYATGIVATDELTLGEQIGVQNLTLTINPTPTSSGTRTLEYWAGHILTGDTTYATLGERDVLAVMLKAQANALLKQASKAAHQAWSYQEGDARVAKEKLSAELRAQANALDTAYLAALQARATGNSGNATSGNTTRAYGTRARYRVEG